MATYEDQEETKEAGTQVTEEFSAEEMAEQERALRTLGYLGGSSSREEPARAGPAAVPEGGESSPEIHNNLGRIHLSQGALDKAQAEFEQALALAPDNADALLNMGSIQRAKGRVPEAEHFVKRALRVNPNSIAALGQLAEIKRDLGELDESVRLYREALAIDDSPPFLYLGLGDSLQRLGRPRRRRALSAPFSSSTPIPSRPTTTSASPTSRAGRSTRPPRASRRRSSSTRVMPAPLSC